jgi:hypothetical protein
MGGLLAAAAAAAAAFGLCLTAAAAAAAGCTRFYCILCEQPHYLQLFQGSFLLLPGVQPQDLQQRTQAVFE